MPPGRVSRLFFSVLRPFAGGGHFDDAGSELRERADEVLLSGHHRVDVLVDPRGLVEARGQQCDALLGQIAFHLRPLELLDGRTAREPPAGTVQLKPGRQRRFALSICTWDKPAAAVIVDGKPVEFTERKVRDLNLCEFSLTADKDSEVRVQTAD